VYLLFVFLFNLKMVAATGVEPVRLFKVIKF